MYRKIAALFKNTFYSLALIGNFLFCNLTAEQPNMPQMSQADIDAMMKMMEDPEMIKIMQEIENDLMKLSPEELAQLEQQARQELVSLGIDPDTFQPVGASQNTGENEAIAKQVVTPEQPRLAPLSVGIIAEDEIARIIRKLIFFVNNIRNKTTTMNSLYPEYKKLLAWQEALDDLAFYLAQLNKPEHHKQLTSKEFEKLTRTLKTLHTTLEKYEPQLEHAVSTEDEELLDDPYEILGLPYTADQEDIEKVYEQYIREKDPKKLQKKLEEEGLDQKDIKRQVRAAQLTFSTVTDAYEKLNDAKIRAQTDRTLQGKIKRAKNALTQRTTAIESIINALSQAVYQEQLLTACEQFMKQYEPVELAKKQALEKAEQQAIKDQEARKKLQPTRTAGGKLDQTYQQSSGYSSYPSSSTSSYPYFDNSYGYGPSQSTPYSDDLWSTPATSQKSSPNSSGGQSSGGSGAKSSSKENDGKEGGDKGSKSDKDKNTASKSKPTSPLDKSIKSFEKELQKLETKYLTDSDIQQALSTLNNQASTVGDIDNALAVLDNKINSNIQTLDKDSDSIRKEINNLNTYAKKQFAPQWKSAYNRSTAVVSPLINAINTAQTTKKNLQQGPLLRGAAPQPVVLPLSPIEEKVAKFSDVMKDIHDDMSKP